MAPTYPIIDQLLEEHMNDLGINRKDLPNLNSMIYLNILKSNIENIARHYDVIILDEYHRCGSQKSGQKVQELLQIIKEKYPNKKVIGTTATEIRYLDNEKNMNDILFDGVCASELSLSDSILQGLLPAPKYITTNKEMLNDLSNTERIIDRYCYTKNQKIEAKKLVEKYK